MILGSAIFSSLEARLDELKNKLPDAKQLENQIRNKIGLHKHVTLPKST